MIDDIWADCRPLAVSCIKALKGRLRMIIEKGGDHIRL
jgi:hypothetical protein